MKYYNQIFKNDHYAPVLGLHAIIVYGLWYAGYHYLSLLFLVLLIWYTPFINTINALNNIYRVFSFFFKKLEKKKFGSNADFGTTTSVFHVAVIFTFILFFFLVFGANTWNYYLSFIGITNKLYTYDFTFLFIDKHLNISFNPYTELYRYSSASLEMHFRDLFLRSLFLPSLLICLHRRLFMIQIHQDYFYAYYSNHVKYRSKAIASIHTEDPTTFVGYSITNHCPIYTSDSKRNTHTQIIGTTGSGKTATYLFPVIYQDIHKGYPVIIADAKGSFDFRNQIMKACEESGRANDFLYIDLNLENKSDTYNPLLEGTYLEIKDKIITMIKWGSEQHYKNLSVDWLSFLISLVEVIDAKLCFSDLYRLTTEPNYFMKLAALVFNVRENKSKSNDYYKRKLHISRELSEIELKQEEEKFDSLIKKTHLTIKQMNTKLNRFLEPLSTFVASIKRINDDVGHIVNTYNPTVLLQEVYKKNQVVYFGLSAQRFGESFDLLANVYLYDIKTLSGFLEQGGKKYKYVMNDYGQIEYQPFFSEDGRRLYKNPVVDGVVNIGIYDSEGDEYVGELFGLIPLEVDENIKDAFIFSHLGEPLSIDKKNVVRLGKKKYKGTIFTLAEKPSRLVAFAKLYEPKHKYIMIHNDEFGDYVKNEALVQPVIVTLSKSRSSNMCYTFTHQVYADLNKVDQTFGDQIAGNVSSVIVFNCTDDETAEKLSVRSGTKHTLKETKQYVAFATDERASIRAVNEFRVHPDSIKNFPFIKNKFRPDTSRNYGAVIIKEDTNLRTDFISTSFIPNYHGLKYEYTPKEEDLAIKNGLSSLLYGVNIDRLLDEAGVLDVESEEFELNVVSLDDDLPDDLTIHN